MPGTIVMGDGGEHPEGEEGPRTTLPHDAPRATEPDLPADAGRSTLTDAEALGAEAPEDEDEVDEPVHPTVEAPSPGKARRAFVWILVGGLLFASVAGPLAFYLLVWRYKPTAPAHIPAGTTMAARLDGRELYLFPPFREHVLSVLEEGEGKNTRAERLAKHTGVDVRSDVREIVVATVDGEAWVVLLGGHFSRPRMNQAALVPGLASFLEEEGATGFSLQGEQLHGPGGVRIAQATDGTVVVASDADTLTAALEPSKHHTELGLASSGALSFVVDRPALAVLARSVGPVGTADPLGKTERLTGFLAFGRRGPELTCDAVPRPTVTPEELSQDYQAATSGAALLLALLPDVAGEREAIGGAAIKPRAASVLISASWPEEGLARGMKRVGEGLRALLGS